MPKVEVSHKIECNDCGVNVEIMKCEEPMYLCLNCIDDRDDAASNKESLDQEMCPECGAETKKVGASENHPEGTHECLSPDCLLLWDNEGKAVEVKKTDNKESTS